MHKKAGNSKGPSEATLATLKGEAEGRSDYSGTSLAANRSTLKTVDSGGSDLFGDEEDKEDKINRK